MPAIDQSTVVHPASKHRPDGSPDLLHGIGRKVRALHLPNDRLELRDQFFQLSGGEVFVELHADGVLFLFEDVLEVVGVFLLFGLHTHHDFAVHLDEPAVRVPGEAFAAGGFGEGFDRLIVHADV